MGLSKRVSETNAGNLCSGIMLFTLEDLVCGRLTGIVSRLPLVSALRQDVACFGSKAFTAQGMDRAA